MASRGLIFTLQSHIRGRGLSRTGRRGMSKANTLSAENQRLVSLIVGLTPTSVSCSSFLLCDVGLIHWLDVFLVSAPPPKELDNLDKPPMREPHGYKRVHLRLKYSENRAGLLLPCLFGPEESPYGLFDFLKEVLEHQSNHGYLYLEARHEHTPPPAIKPHTLLYLMADHLWTTNMRYLDKQVKEISFEHIQNPRTDTDTELHELREDLEFAKTEIKQTLRYAPEELREYFVSGQAWRSTSSGSHRPRDTPLRPLEQTAEDAAALQEFLTNSLNFLLASIAVRDSQRAEMLTWLAAIYVPLSFVTGIFGINLRELNDSSLPIWVCFEVLGVVLVLTLALVWFYKKLRPHLKSS